MGGAAVAELTHHDAGRGAAAGAIGGAVIQRVKQQQAAQQQQAKQQAAQQQASQQQASARSQQRATYERAMGACMEGRGYTVK
jgi:ADP-ribosylglycohydrolase